jgi:hypothetical protein
MDISKVCCSRLPIGDEHLIYPSQRYSSEDGMEGRVILKNGEMIAVRVLDGTYSVFRMKTKCEVSIGDVFLGTLSSAGSGPSSASQLLLHSNSETVVEVQFRLAGSQVAAKTKQAIAYPY